MTVCTEYVVLLVVAVEVVAKKSSILNLLSVKLNFQENLPAFQLYSALNMWNIKFNAMIFILLENSHNLALYSKILKCFEK